MTNHFNDMEFTDCALIIGSNAAENHPMTFKWLTKAKENKGAKIISVDPRFTRTSARSDIYARMRSGTDIPFIGGMINYILENNLYNEEYVKWYTNATFIVNEDYSFDDGLFVGYDEDNRVYDQSKWAFETEENGDFVKDMDMQHPRCVFQLLKKHYSRYDVKTVCNLTGTPENKFLETCKTFGATGQPGKAGTILYAMGTTQHTVGAQNVRSYGMIQLLLGNVGQAGGGINALRGECNVQGATDSALLFHIIPAYIGSPVAKAHPDLDAYNAVETPASGYWTNKPKFLASLLKAWWMDDTPEKAYNYLPKRVDGKNYSHMAMFEAMYNGEMEGLFVWGGNPVVGGPNANKELAGLANLKWLVVADIWKTETSEFWSYDAWNRPNNVNPYGNKTPRDIDTEVFFMPAVCSYEKEGAVSNSGRWAQYRWKAADGVGDSKSDSVMMNEIMLRIKEYYASKDTPENEPINRLTWDYGPKGDYPDLDFIAKEINGYSVENGRPGKQLGGFGELQDDGSTACGMWIYCGSYPEEGKNLTKRRDNTDVHYSGVNSVKSYSNWSWCWPLNRRILYNRASCTPEGKPWNPDEPVIWWDGERWVGNDVPDFAPTNDPNSPTGRDAFIMQATGVGGLFANMVDGPFPEHYEPWESPVKSTLNKVEYNPAVYVWEPDKRGKADKYPLLATTYRVTEHWQSGIMTRTLPWLAELVPDVFVELSEELAREKGINNGSNVIITTTRGDMKAVACVTKRIKPMIVSGESVHQVGIIWHFGFNGYAKGDTANWLTPHIGDATVMCPEYKAFLCDVRRA